MKDINWINPLVETSQFILQNTFRYYKHILYFQALAKCFNQSIAETP